MGIDDDNNTIIASCVAFWKRRSLPEKAFLMYVLCVVLWGGMNSAISDFNSFYSFLFYLYWGFIALIAVKFVLLIRSLTLFRREALEPYDLLILKIVLAYIVWLGFLNYTVNGIFFFIFSFPSWLFFGSCFDGCHSNLLLPFTANTLIVWAVLRGFCRYSARKKASQKQMG